jgi:hypothetical protein
VIKELQMALQKRFPGVEFVVKEANLGSQLVVTFRLGDTRYVVSTPEDEPYKAQDLAWWLHRFSEAIATKVKPSVY